jgi:hypothetical protein
MKNENRKVFHIDLGDMDVKQAELYIQKLVIEFNKNREAK